MGCDWVGAATSHHKHSPDRQLHIRTKSNFRSNYFHACVQKLSFIYYSSATKLVNRKKVDQEIHFTQYIRDFLAFCSPIVGMWVFA